MTYGSVCSGIEAISVAWGPLGMHPAWFAEIEKFPAAVLDHRFSYIPNFGDFTLIRNRTDVVPESIDILVGGTPCQDFSVAGLRAGLDGDRGNLCLEFLRLAAHLRPRWLLWENVPGVRSSGGGRDLGTFLGAMGKLGYGFAYRSLDAQYFGLAQRRERVFVVGYLGDWRRAAAVLFERHSLQGHPPPSRKTREETTGTIAARTRGGGGLGTDFDCDGGLIAHSLRASGFSASAEGSTGLPFLTKSNIGKNVNNQTPLLAFSAKDHGANGGGQVAVAFAQNQRDEVRLMDVAGALSNQPGMKQQTYVAQTFQTRFTRNDRGGPSEIVPALTSSECGGHADTKPHVFGPGMRVRRLTPLECERLQGFPDNWTRIPWRGKPAELCPDGPRYCAIGNSMAVSVMRWIGKRILIVDYQQVTIDRLTGRLGGISGIVLDGQKSLFEGVEA